MTRKRRLAGGSSQEPRSKRKRPSPQDGLFPEDESIWVVAPKAEPAPLLRELPELYRSGLYCDAEVVCADGGVVRCHKAVLASLSSMMAASFTDEDDPARIVLPHHDSDSVGHFFAGVYGCLGYSQEFAATSDMLKCESVFSALSVDCVPWPVLDPLVVILEECAAKATVTRHWSVKEETEENKSWIPKGEGFDGDLKEEAEGANGDVDWKVEGDEAEGGPGWEELVPEVTANVEPRAPKQRRGRRKNRRKRRANETRETMPMPPSMPDPKTDELGALVSKGSGQVTVRFRKEFFPEEQSKKFKRSTFQCLLGVKADGTSLRGRPVTFSPGAQLAAEDYERQFEVFAGAAKAVLGMSDVEVYDHSLIRLRMGLKKAKSEAVNSPYYVKRELARHSEQELRAVLEEPNVAAAHQTNDPRQKVDQQLISDEEDAMIELATDIAPDEFQALACLFYDPSEEILHAQLLGIGDGSSREKDVKACVRLVFDMWTLRTDGTLIPKCPELLDKYKWASKLALRRSVAKTRLAEIAAGVVRELETKQCPDCGVVFPYVSIRERIYYRVHIRNHYYEKYKCDCEVTWETVSAKRMHVHLVHMDGFAKCDNCNYVCKTTFMAKHNEALHEKKTCEFCGAVLSGSTNHAIHLKTVHAQGNAEKKSCQLCGAKVKGKLERHVRQVHGGEEENSRPCPHCGKRIKGSAHALKHHILTAHMDPEKLPFPCEQCDKRYPTKWKLRRHILAVHVGAKYVLCRYEGCDAAYNDSGSRANHERLTHGQIYTKAAKLGLVPEEPTKNYRLNEMGLPWHKGGDIM